MFGHRRNRGYLLLLLLAACFAEPIAAAPVLSNGTVPDIVGAFDAIRTDRAAYRGVMNRNASSPSTVLGHYNKSQEHFQSVQRPHSGGGYLYVSGDATGDIFAIHFPDAPTGRSGYFGDTVNTQNQFVYGWRVGGGCPHAGGFQIEGDYLAVGSELCNGFVKIYDISNRTNILPVSTIDRMAFTGSGAVGLVRMANGTYLLIVTANASKGMALYRSDTTTITTATRWTLIDNFNPTTAAGRFCEGGDPVSPHFGDPQTINLFRQNDGALFMVATDRFDGDDMAYLFRLRFMPSVPSDCGIASSGGTANRVRFYKERELHMYVPGEHSFDKAAGLFLDTTNNRFIVYSVAPNFINDTLDYYEF